LGGGIRIGGWVGGEVGDVVFENVFDFVPHFVLSVEEVCFLQGDDIWFLVKGAVL
jgi:hypothetical protein